ncbi:hypothetical protein [Corynebacterium variabile]|uniref:hypothetical protein n=1 Tax=Corynebacterium variabile TaxID=1727 RepID=UPI0028D5BEC8|nr:hypothetical protein [Corynebacterium variabile]
MVYSMHAEQARRPARATAVLSSVLAAALLASCTSAVGERRDAADGAPSTAAPSGSVP